MSDDAVDVEPLDTEVRPGVSRERLAAQGYTVDMDIATDGVHCHGCDHVHDADEVTIEATHRYEGQTNPGDEQTVLAVRCPCGCAGTATAAAGAYGDSAVGDAVRRMQDGRDR